MSLQTGRRQGVYENMRQPDLCFGWFVSQTGAGLQAHLIYKWQHTHLDCFKVMIPRQAFDKVVHKLKSGKPSTDNLTAHILKESPWCSLVALYNLFIWMPVTLTIPISFICYTATLIPEEV